MRDRFLRKLADHATSKPHRTLLVAVVFTVVCAALIPGLRIDAGHSALFDSDDAHQKRLEHFLERFGSPDLLFVLVEGGTRRLRHELIDALNAKLPQGPRAAGGGCPAPPSRPHNAAGCVRDVVGRIALEQLTPFGLLYLRPKDLQTVVDTLTDEHIGLRKATEIRSLPALIAAVTEEVDRRAQAPPPTGEAAKAASMAMKLAARFADEMALRTRDERRSRVSLPDAFLSTFGEKLRSRLQRSGIDERGYLVSRDGALDLAIIRPVDGSDEPTVVVPFVAYVRGIAEAQARAITARCARERKASCGARPLSIQLTGLPALIAEEKDVLERDVFITSVAAASGILLIFIVGFRSLRQGLMGLVPLALALLGTLAFVRLVYGQLNMITQAFIPTVLGLGIDFSVHLLSRFNEARRGGAAAAAAVRAAVTRAGPGIITGGLTTAGAFLTLTVNEFKGFEQLGVITAFGMTLSFFAALTVGAAMLCAPSLSWLQVPPKAPRARRGVIGRFVERRPFLIIGAGLVITALMVWRGTAIPWSYNYLELLPANSPAVAAMETLAKRTDYSGEVAAIEVDSMEKARAVTAALRKKPSVGRIESVATYIPSAQQEKLAKINLLRPVFKQLEAATSQPASRAAPASAPDRELDLEALRANLRELADNLEDARFSAKSAGRDVAARLLKGPLDALHRLLKTIDKTPAADARRRLGRFEAQIVGGLKLGLKLLKRGVFSGPLTPQALLDRLPSGLRDRLHTADGHFAIYIYPSQWLWAEGFLRRFVSELREVDPDVTGFPVTHWEANLTIERGFRTASLLASLALLVLLFVDFRSVRYTVLAVVPLALGVGWMWGGISLMSMSYNFANIVGFPLIIGIGVASGVHILHRFRQEGERNVASVVQHTGQAILLSALTSMAGFGSLALASHRGAASLGVVLLMGVGFCLLTATLALPALLQCLGRRGGAAPPADGGETP